MKPQPTAAMLVGCLPTLALLGGCAPKITEFQITDHRPTGPQLYHQTFEECYYRHDAANNLEIVARQRTTSPEGSQTVQVIHLKTFWEVRPGRTRAERSMLNTRVSYMILTWPTGGAFEGSGFLTYSENRSRDGLRGHLELASLKPQRRLGNAEKLFDRAELSGEITASRSDSRVIEILNEMKQIFGPPPDRIPPPSDPDY